MKNRQPIGTLGYSVDKNVTIAGWVHNIRDLKNVQFVLLRDNSGVVQTVNEKKGDELEKTIYSLTPESVIAANGRVIRNERVKLGQLEVQLSGIQVYSNAQKPLPIDENTSSSDARLDWRFLDMRRPKNNLIFRVQTTAEHAMRSFWNENKFIEIHSPKLTPGATESGAELFQLDYFGQKASLAQSPQFYKQMAMASGLDRVFEIGPVFRANPSYTKRHDTEFTSVDVEMSWIDSHYDVMELEEKWLQYVLGEVETRHGREIKDHFGVDIKVPKTPFPKISMKDAQNILEKISSGGYRDEKGDLSPEGERALSEYVKNNFDHEFAFIIDYPITARPFYHMRYDDNPQTTRSFDLLWKGLEVTTGAQREHRYERLFNQALEKGIDPEAISHYLNFFRYGCPPHGGYGFGLTRMLMVLLGAPNVREVTYIYRGPNRLTP